MSSSVGSRRIPAAIPDLDQGQFLPLGDDDEFTFGVRDSDGALVIQSDSVGSDLVIDSNLNVTIPGSLTVNGQTTTVDDIATTDVFVEQADGTDVIHLSGDTTPEFIHFLTDDGEMRFGAAPDAVLRFVPGAGANGAFVVEDEVNDARFLQFNIGSNIEIDGKILEIKNAADDDYFALTDGTTGDVYRMRGFADGTFGIAIRDDSTATERDVLRFPPASGVVQLGQDGTAGTPGLGFADDADTGLFRNGADDMRLVDNGVARLAINGAVTALANVVMGGNAIDGDDAFEIIFGTGDDMDVTYVAGNDALEWADRGTSSRMQLDRTSGNLNIEGSLTEGAAL